MLQALKSEKPWAKLRLTRREYETKRPWAAAGINRKRWEEILLEFPDEAITALYLEADAEKLVEAMFGKVE